MTDAPAFPDHFEILDSVEGGQATVYRARDGRRGDLVAIRCANAATRSDPRRLARFQESLRALARMQDEGVLYVHELVERGADSYLVTEWLDDSLADWMQRGAVEGPVAVSILEKIAGGLRALHQAGLVHRDLQPPNVLLSADAEFVRIADLGGAEGTLGDSPMYTAPEAYDEEAAVDGRSDLYSLGMIALELLLGTERFRAAFPEIYGAGSDASRRARWINWHRDPERIAPRLEEAAPETPRALAELVARLLSKDPAGRPVDADEVLRILATVGAFDGGGAAPLPVLELPDGRAPRFGGGGFLGLPRWALATVGVLLLLAVGVLFIATRGPSAKDLAYEAGVAMKAARDRAIAAGAPERPDILVWPEGETVRGRGLAAYEGREFETARSEFLAATDLYIEAERLALLPPPEAPPDEGADAGTGDEAASGAGGGAPEEGASGPTISDTTAPPPVYQVGSTAEEIDAAVALCARHQARCDRSIYESEVLREVALQPYEIDAREVTNAEYQAFVEATGYETDAERRGYAFVFGGFGSVKAPGASWRAPAGPGGPPPLMDRPVVNVSANDAAAYCRHVGGRLPTAEEWEFAARGLDRRIFPWGDDWEDGRAVWGPDSTVGPGAGAAGATPEGIEDLAGNVWEWTASVRDGRHVLKGGSHLEANPSHLRAAFERLDAPDAAHPDDGFRCARDR